MKGALPEDGAGGIVEDEPHFSQNLASDFKADPHPVQKRAASVAEDFAIGVPHPVQND